MAEGQVTIEVLLDSKGFKDGVSKLSSMAKKGLSPAMKATGAATAAVTGFAGAAVKAGMEYESAFAGVRKTVDATEAEYKQLSDGIRDMAKEMPQSAAEIAGVAEAAGQLGIHKESILGFTKTMTQLGDATNLSSEEAATSLARFANVMGMSQDDFDKLGSTIVNLGNNLATTESEIVEMGQRVAGAGKQVDMTESQVMGWSAAMSSVGINAEAGGTAFSTLITKMNAGVQSGGKQLNQFAKVAGMSSDQFKQAFNEDSSAAIEAFISGLSDIKKSGGDVMGTLSDMGLSNIRIRDTLLRLAGAEDVMHDALKIGNEGWQENTALTKEVENRYSTLESQISMLKNQVVDIGIEIFQSTNGPLNDAVKAASTNIKKISTAYKKGGAEAAAKAAGESLGKMVGSASRYVPKMADLGIKALKAFVKGVVKNRKQIVNAAKELVKTLADAVGDMIPGALGKAFKNVGKIVASAIGPMVEIAGVAGKVAGALSNLVPIVGGLMAAFKLNAFLNSFVAGLKLLAVGQEAATASTIANTLATRVNAATKTAAAAKTVLLTGVTEGMTVAQVAATVATNALNAALTFMGGPIGIAVAAMGALAGAALIFGDNQAKASAKFTEQAKSIKALGKEIDELSDAYERNRESRNKTLNATEAEAGQAEQYAKRLEDLAKNHNKNKDEIAEEKRLVEQLNDLVPDLNLKYDEQADSLSKTTEEIHKKIDAMKEEARVSALNDIIKDTYKDQYEHKKKEREATEELTKAEKDYAKAKESYEQNKKTRMGAEVNTQERQDYLAAEENLRNAQKKKAEVDQLMNDTQADITAYENMLTDTVSGTSSKVAESAVNLDAVAAEAGIKASKIPQSIYQGIQTGVMATPTTGAELQTLIDYTELEKKASDAGIKIPKSITDGIKAGGSKASAAVTQLNNLIKFDPIKKKAQAAGVDIPKSVTKGIRTGKYAVPKSMSELKSLIKLDAKAKMNKSGKESTEAAAKGMSSSLSKVKKASQDVSEEAGKAASKGKKTFSKTGSDSSTEYGKGLGKNKGKVMSSAKGVSSSANKGFASGKGGASTAGRQVTAGFTSGMSSGSGAAAAVARSIVRNAIAAMNAEADSHSPSRKTKKLGKYMYQGLIIGMGSGQKWVNKSAKAMIKKALDAAKSVKGNYASIGQTLVERIESSIQKQDNKITKVFKKRADKASKKAGKTGKKAINRITSELNKALNSQRKKLVSQAEKTFEKIGEKYQEKYDDLVSKRDNLTNTLRTYGSMLAETANSAFTATFGKINEYSLATTIKKRLKNAVAFDDLYKEMKSKLPDDVMAEVLGLGDTEALKVLKKFSKMSEEQLDDYLKKYRDYKTKIEAITEATASSSDKNVLDVLLDNKAAKEKFERYVNDLRKYSDTQELGEAVLGMGVEDGTKFLEQFFSLTEQQRQDYIKTWNEDYKNAEAYAKSYYKDQFAKVKADYNAEMKAASTQFNKTMTQVGKDTIKGFIAGLKSQKKHANGTMKSIINSAITAAKKALKIKSPSRVFDEIGQLTIAGAEQGSEREANSLYRTAESIATTFADRFKAALPGLDFTSLQDAAAVVQAVNPLLKNQILAGAEAAEEAGEDRVYEFHFVTNLDGKEVAHETARYMNTELGGMKELNARC